MALNRCEAYLLKLTIPFIRIAHLPRSADFKVLGPMICVEAKVAQTINDLPRDQQFVPVEFKRRLEFKGYYIGEVVDTSKVLKHFN